MLMGSAQTHWQNNVYIDSKMTSCHWSFHSLQIWKGLTKKTGCDLKYVVKMLSEGNIINNDVRDKSIGHVSVHINRFLCKRYMPNKNKKLEIISQAICIGKFYPAG